MGLVGFSTILLTATSRNILKVKDIFSRYHVCRRLKLSLTQYSGVRMSFSQVKKPTLVVFDFDHTVIEDNSDVFVQTLAENGKIPDEINKTYRSKNWIDFMNNVFNHLHTYGTTPENILNCMAQMTWVPGMEELFRQLIERKQEYEAIIISDSNSIFINRILEVAGLQEAIKKIFTNEAHFESNGLLRVLPFHHQDWCDLSTENMCKGHILDSYVETRHKEGVEFERIAYVGDGSNDFCPSLRLSKNDFVFPRKGFALMKLIEKQSGPEVVDKQIVAKVIPWEFGLEIFQIISNQK